MAIIFVSSTAHALIMMVVILVNVTMDMKVMVEQNVIMSMNALEGSVNVVNSQYALIKKVLMIAPASTVMKTSQVELVKYVKTSTNVPLGQTIVQPLDQVLLVSIRNQDTNVDVEMVTKNRPLGVLTSMNVKPMQKVNVQQHCVTIVLIKFSKLFVVVLSVS